MPYRLGRPEVDWGRRGDPLACSTWLRTYACGVAPASVTPVEPGEHRPFSAGPFRWRLGLRPLDIEHWIEIGPHHDAVLAEKDRLLSRFPGTVFAAIDGIEDESNELLDVLTAHLVKHVPDRYAVDGDDIVAAGRRFSRSRLHPLDLAGRLVDEDIAVLVERGGDLVFGGGSICFPNRWDLRSKLGQSMADVHAPVAGLNEQLARPIDQFFERLSPQRSFWRLGWTVLDTPERYQPVCGTGGSPLARDAQQLHLRVERETLRRLPATDVVVFTIRTYITPLVDLVVEPDDARRLAEALRQLPDDVAGYKGLRGWRLAAATWLDEAVDNALAGP